MMRKYHLMLSILILALFAGGVRAGEPVDKAVADKLRKHMESTLEGLVVDSISSSELPGLYEVMLQNGIVVYASVDGKYVLEGNLLAATADGYINVTEQRRDVARKRQLAVIDKKDMIIFPAKDNKAKTYVTVFTDVTCFYCQKLHKEVPELNRRGVEVRYLAYPREGVGSPGFRQLATAWCSKDPAASLTRLKEGKSVSGQVCAGNPVAAQYMLGQKLGVRGTPAIIDESGRMIPGYRSADQLMADLGLN
ncbi:MAG: DsbC family protein [Parahaliea sp.]